MSKGADIEKAYALIIGISEYKDPGIRRLNYTHADAEGIFKLLTDPKKLGISKDNIKILLDRDATLFNIKDAISNWLYKNAEKDSVVFIFFAGHGGVEEDPRGIEKDNLAKYLLPFDSVLDNLYASALSNRDFNDLLLTIRSKKLVIFMDSCYSGGVSERTRDVKITEDPYKKLGEGEGRLVIAASQPDQRSYEDSRIGHGVFTYNLLEALSGKADLDNDGYVTVLDAYKYLQDSVPRDAMKLASGKQEPILRGDITKDFVISVDREHFEKIEKERVLEEKLGILQNFYDDGKLSGKQYDYLRGISKIELGELKDKNKKIAKRINDLLSGNISITTFLEELESLEPELFGIAETKKQDQERLSRQKEEDERNQREKEREKADNKAKLRAQKEAEERKEREEQESIAGEKEELKGGEKEKKFPYKKFLIVIIGMLLVGYLIYPAQTTGSISVSSSPSGANIYLDGSNQGTTPMTIKSVIEGSHTITLKLTDYQDLSQTIRVVAGEIAYVSPVLTSISSNPKITPTVTPILSQVWTTSSKRLNVLTDVFNNNLDSAVKAGLDRTGYGQTLEFGNYYTLDLNHDKYVAVNGKIDRLAKLLLEQTSEQNKTLTVGDTWDIGGGWTLQAQAIDARTSPKQAWFVLSKDGIKKDEMILSEKKIYTYVQKSLQDQYDVPLFVTYIDRIFSGATTDMVKLRYTWLIGSELNTIKVGDVYGGLEVVTVDIINRRIELKPYTSIT